MSSLYNLEPQPTAKVVLKTTSGDLALELFAKQTPLASRNFLQHCLDGYYNNTVFHRLVPGFILQGGDPTGTGSGGVSAINDGAGFEDEFHSRLKFNRRGLLGMANEGKDSNGSQFFLTLGVTAELQGRNTMFGRIEGDTIYNLMKMAEAELVEVEGSERPLYPTRITAVEILVNPFDDLVTTVNSAPRTNVDFAKQPAKKRKKPAGKNALSFGMDEGEGETMAPVLKKAKANPKLVNVGDDAPEKLSNAIRAKPAVQHQRNAEQEVVEAARSLQPSGGANVPRAPIDQDDYESDDDDEPEQTKKQDNVLERTNAEIAALKASMKRRTDAPPKEREKPKNALEAMIPTTATRGRKRGKATDENGALEIFKSFKVRLEGLPPEPAHSATTGEHVVPAPEANGKHTEPTTAEDDEAELCDLHFIANCQSCKSWDEEKPDGEARADGDEDPGWMAHSLSFAKDTLGKDLEWKRKMAEIEVIDPREKAKAINEEKRKDKRKW